MDILQDVPNPGILATYRCGRTCNRGNIKNDRLLCLGPSLPWLGASGGSESQEQRAWDQQRGCWQSSGSAPEDCVCHEAPPPRGPRTLLQNSATSWGPHLKTWACKMMEEVSLIWLTWIHLLGWWAWHLGKVCYCVPRPPMSSVKGNKIIMTRIKSLIKVLSGI